MQLTIMQDTQDLEQLEQVISDNLQSFYRAGRALTGIRDRELYKIKNGGEYQTFAAYCKGVWDISRPRAYQLIDAAGVQDNLSTMVDKPIPERQARPLAKLDAEQQRQAWQKVVETAPAGKVTAAHISTVIRSIAGNPPCEKQEPASRPVKQETPISIAQFAISQLEHVEDNDPEIQKVFSMLEKWIEKRRNNIDAANRRATKLQNYELVEPCVQ